MDFDGALAVRRSFGACCVSITFMVASLRCSVAVTSRASSRSANAASGCGMVPASRAPTPSAECGSCVVCASPCTICSMACSSFWSCSLFCPFSVLMRVLFRELAVQIFQPTT